MYEKPREEQWLVVRCGIAWGDYLRSLLSAIRGNGSPTIMVPDIRRRWIEESGQRETVVARPWTSVTLHGRRLTASVQKSNDAV